MKEGWEYKKLGEVATFVNGYPFKPSDWKGNGRKIIRIQNLNNPTAEYNYYDGSIDSKYLVIKGDVLISWSGSLGVFEWSKDEAILNQHIFKVVFNKGKINKRFFEYVVSSRLNEMKAKVHGITMQHITKKDFDVIPIPIPPLTEQERIVSELDLLTSIISKQKAQLKELDSLAQSIFYDMFGDPIENPKGWEIGCFNDICEVTSSKRVYQSEWQSSGIPFYRISDFTFLVDNAEITPELFISQEKYNELKNNNQVPKSGDILVSTRGTLGKCYIIKKGDHFYFQDGMITWLKNIDRKVHPLFIVFLFNNDSFRRQIDKKQAGSTVAYLSISMIKQFILPLPPLSLQQSFASKIEAIEAQKALITKSMEETQRLFGSRMDYWFA